MGRSKSVSIEESAITHIINDYKNRAKRKGYGFSISRERFIELIQKPCFYDNVEKSNNYKGYRYNGIDRVDSSKGYEEGNVVPCCKKCNTAKNNMGKGGFFAWVFKVSRLLKERIVGTGILREIDPNTIEAVDELSLCEMGSNPDKDKTP